MPLSAPEPFFPFLLFLPLSIIDSFPPRSCGVVFDLRPSYLFLFLGVPDECPSFLLGMTHAALVVGGDARRFLDHGLVTVLAAIFSDPLC